MKPGNNVLPVALKTSAPAGIFADLRLPAAAILAPLTTTTAFETGDPLLPSISVAPTMATTRFAAAAGGLISFSETTGATETVSASRARIEVKKRTRIVRSLRFRDEDSRIRLYVSFHDPSGRIKLHPHTHFAASAQTKVAFGRRKRVIAVGALAVEDSHLLKPQEFFGLAALGDANLRVGRAAVSGRAGKPNAQPVLRRQIIAINFNQS